LHERARLRTAGRRPSTTPAAAPGAERRGAACNEDDKELDWPNRTEPQ
jgi:hypothetical protein